MPSQFSRLAGVSTLLAMLAGPALADGSLKDTPKAQERCKHSANVALTTDYIFRGFSQTSDGPAIQGGYDLTCGIFYTGVWASNLDWGTGFNGATNVTNANIEMDWYMGIKPVTGRITWDFGVIYYSYPHASDIGANPNFPPLVPENNRSYNYVEFKAGASTTVWKDGTLSLTVFYSPEYQYETGSVWTVEGQFTQVFRKFKVLEREWTPSFSALLAWQGNTSDKAAYIANVTGDNNSYLYWNAGLTLGFLDKWSLDFRYWDTSIDRNTAVGFSSCSVHLFSCDQHYVATLKFTY